LFAQNSFPDNNRRSGIKKDDYINYQKKLIDNPYDPLKGRVPKFNEQTRLFESRLKTFEDFKREKISRFLLRKPKINTFSLRGHFRPRAQVEERISRKRQGKNKKKGR